jgi:hypothetical protein
MTVLVVRAHRFLKGSALPRHSDKRMIDKPHQIKLMLGAARDYQDGLMSLQTLIWKIEGLLDVIEDEALSDDLSDGLFALEEINAYTYMPGYDFEARGRSVVDRAVKEIIAKTESYSSRSA